MMVPVCLRRQLPGDGQLVPAAHGHHPQKQGQLPLLHRPPVGAPDHRRLRHLRLPAHVHEGGNEALQLVQAVHAEHGEAHAGAVVVGVVETTELVVDVHAAGLGPGAEGLVVAPPEAGEGVALGSQVADQLVPPDVIVLLGPPELTLNRVQLPVRAGRHEERLDEKLGQHIQRFLQLGVMDIKIVAREFTFSECVGGPPVGG
mmetsp:Transcript_38252/g.91961  ORF Transcript_38252/g.91961 Transcript_38252/m.91961 type:complete len:202 (+) Transcript_38252:973-1578(+)